MVLIYLSTSGYSNISHILTKQSMDLHQNFTCPLCLELAKEAVQSSCCTKIFCLQCIRDATDKFGHCPCCRNDSIATSPSRIARKVIAEIKVPCPHCELPVENGQLGNHLHKCPKVFLKCRLCEEVLAQSSMPDHTAKVHQKEARDYLLRYVQEQKQRKVSRVLQPPRPMPEGQNYFEPVLNKDGRRATLGTTGKYYCGGQLKGKCYCCNGQCGIDDGENCDACMALDVRRWNLARTYLLSPVGYVCQVIRVQGAPRVSCFRIHGSKKGGVFSKGETLTCKVGSSCSPCQQVQNSIGLGRYAGLY